MDRWTVIPCYSTHHTQAWRYRGLWTDGQSYLAIAHTTLRLGDTEGYGQMHILFIVTRVIHLLVTGIGWPSFTSASVRVTVQWLSQHICLV